MPLGWYSSFLLLVRVGGGWVVVLDEIKTISAPSWDWAWAELGNNSVMKSLLIYVTNPEESEALKTHQSLQRCSVIATFIYNAYFTGKPLNYNTKKFSLNIYDQE